MTEVTLLIILLALTVPRSAWYQRYRLRATLKSAGANPDHWVVVNHRGIAAVVGAEKPTWLSHSALTGWMLPHGTRSRPVSGYWPALRNTSFLVR